jgi:hypothetical protein
VFGRKHGSVHSCRDDDEPFWLSAAVDPEGNHVLHGRRFPRQTTALTEVLLAERKGKRTVEHAVFPVDGAP